MNMQGTTKSRLLNVCVALGLIATASPLAAQSTPTAGAVAKTISFEVGGIVTNPKTTTYSNQHALINRTIHTTGQPPVSTYTRYKGNVSAYQKTVRAFRNGKAMEAVFAHSENSRLAATGSGKRILVTAVEGFPADPADLVMVDKNGRVVNQIQSKTGSNNARKALLDPKYKGMSILTDQDSFNTIRRDLLKAETKAARRGLPLAKEWKAVKDSLKSGRLLSRTPSGAPLPTLAHVEKQSVQALKKAWQVTSKHATTATASGTTRASAKSPKATPRAPSAIPPRPRPVYIPKPGDGPGPHVLIPGKGKGWVEAEEWIEKIRKQSGSLGKHLARGLIAVGVVVEGRDRYRNGTQIEKDFKAGTINQQQREIRHAENVAGAVGGWTGAFGCALAGVKGGAVAGSLGGPIGTGVCGFVGGVAGGVAGYFGGEVAAKKAAHYLVEKIHAAGTTVADVATATKNGVVAAAVATKDGVVYAAKATANGVVTAAKATKDGAVYAAKATANGVVTAAKATKDGVVYAAKATANGVVTAAKATKDGAVYAAKTTANGVVTAAKATKNGVVNAASATGNFFKRGWERFGW